MTPDQFISTWKHSDLNERQGAQLHFNALCDLLDVPKPTGASLMDAGFGFEVNVDKVGGGGGFADAWKRGCFAWEYKSPGGDLKAALKQLKLYASDLENPPLLIVSDMRRIELHTNWTAMVQEKHVFELDDLAEVHTRQRLRAAFDDAAVYEFRPNRSANATTEEVAAKFVVLAQSLRERGHDAEQVAHFINRMIFCMFAEDVNLLPKKKFQEMLEASLTTPQDFVHNASSLFNAMARQHGRVGYDAIEWFNGGLFEDGAALPLLAADIRVALEAARQNWSEINPSIMGTQFERGLDPCQRSQLGKFYTDAEKITLIVQPVIVDPLLSEWAAVRDEIEAKLVHAATLRSAGARTRAKNEAETLRITFLERLKNFRVLDPACGSGNFLYLALKSLKDIEARVNLEAESMGLSPQLPAVGPECVKGIEINSFAAELARVSVWIGEIQWMREKGYGVSKNPILKSLHTIECRDALLEADAQAEWPIADVIIGNPPFLGANSMIGVLGGAYTQTLRSVYGPATGGAVDLVAYWFAKAWNAIEAGRSAAAGFVSTQAVRRGSSQNVLSQIAERGRIFNAWDDEPWVVDGASVRVSLVCFDRQVGGPASLDGKPVTRVFSDLSSGVALDGVAQLAENAGVAFQGPVKVGAFDVPGDLARNWLLAPTNPNGLSNSHVLRPWANGSDITGRPSGKWIIDFGEMAENEAALFERPFQHLVEFVKPDRENNRRERRRTRWWQHGETVPGLRRSLAQLERYIATPRVAKHRIFVWQNSKVLPDTRLVAIARDDDTTFGILHSRFHQVWSLRLGGWHGVGNDPQYTPSLGFETFPFPEGLTPDNAPLKYPNERSAKTIASAAARLDERRNNWLNPAELVRRVPEIASGFPDRILAVDEVAANLLNDRTLTKLYNERPAWLDNAHRELDAAVAAAYCWPTDLTDEQILERLFALNQARATKHKQPVAIG